jgi:hypothetical protein
MMRAMAAGRRPLHGLILVLPILGTGAGRAAGQDLAIRAIPAETTPVFGLGPSGFPGPARLGAAPSALSAPAGLSGPLAASPAASPAAALAAAPASDAAVPAAAPAVEAVVPPAVAGGTAHPDAVRVAADSGGAPAARAELDAAFDGSSSGSAGADAPVAPLREARGQRAADSPRGWAKIMKGGEVRRYDAQSPPVKGRVIKVFGQTITELGVVVRSRNPRVQYMIDRLRSYGGELRLAESVDSATGKPVEDFPTRFDFYSAPPNIVIGVGDSMDALEHEFAHFADYAAVHDRLKAAGWSAARIRRRVIQLFDSPSFRTATETRAMVAQRQARVLKTRGRRPRRTADVPSAALPREGIDAFVAEMTYPQQEGLRLLVRDKLSVRGLRQANAQVDDMIRAALAVRRAIFMRARRELQAHPRMRLARYRRLKKLMARQVDLGPLMDQALGGASYRLKARQVDRLEAVFYDRMMVVLPKSPPAETDEFWRRIRAENGWVFGYDLD